MITATRAARAIAALAIVGAVANAMGVGARDAKRAVVWSSSANDTALAVLESATHEVTAPPTSSAARVTTCDEAKTRVTAMLARDDEVTSDEAMDLATMGGDVASLAADGGGTCVDAVLAVMRTAPRCSRGWSAVVSGMLASPSTPDDAMERLAAETTPACAELLLRGLSTGVHATPRLVAFAETTAFGATGEESRRTTAWLALGTLGRLASTLGDRADLAAHVEDVIRTALRGSSEGDRVLMLEAAGNAACASCAPEIALAALSPRWDVRRAAASAWRFQSGADAPKAICALLLRDKTSSVRENAAWAMRWRDDDDVERVECLVTAAATDPTDAVRRAARGSLVVLAEGSEDARSALRHIDGAHDVSSDTLAQRE